MLTEHYESVMINFSWVSNNSVMFSITYNIYYTFEEDKAGI